MPSLYLYNATAYTCQYEAELSNPFNSTYYYAIRITGTYYGTETSNVSSYVHHKNETGSSSRYVYGTIDDGLVPGRTFTLYLYGQARNGTWYYGGSDTITMQSVMGALTGLYVSDTTTSSIRVAWDSTLGAYDYEIEVDGVYRGWTTSTNYNVTGLNDDTRYRIDVYPCDSGGNRGTGDYIYAWTDERPVPDPITGLQTTNITHNSITFIWNSSYGATWYEIYVDGSYVADVYVTGANLIELEPDTRYRITVFPCNNYGTGVSDTIYVWTNSPPVTRPQDWNWTTTERNAFNYNGLLTVLTYTRWNSFIDRINDFCDYKDIDRLPTNVKMTSLNKILYATDFRTIAIKLHTLSGAVSSELRNVSQNDVVYGWYFTHLESAMEYI